MSFIYLLDTNILSEPLKVSPSVTVLAKLEQHQQQIATAAIVWHELVFGCERLPKSRKKTVIRRYIDEVVQALTILPYDTSAADWHAQERARLARNGLTPAFSDGQIAAIAKTHNLILVSRNVDDFTAFDGVVVENWFLPP